MSEFLTLPATIVFTLFAFAYGACFGSFLNVLVWRLPQRMPIALARSHCPKCKHELLGRDNIPIIGWLRLKGRCRFCDLPISRRYPLVELGIGIVFSGLFILIVVTHGATLPQGWNHRHSMNWLSEFPNCPLLIVYLQQCVLAYLLIAIALIDEDRHVCPWTLTLFGIGLQALFLWWDPVLTQLGQFGHTPTQNSPDISWGTGVTLAIMGGMLGIGLGGLSKWARLPHHSINAMQSLLLLGMFMGPVVLIWAALIAGTSLLVQRVSSRFVARSAEQPQSLRTSPRVTGLALQLTSAWLIILCSWRWWPEIVWVV